MQLHHSNQEISLHLLVLTFVLCYMWKTMCLFCVILCTPTVHCTSTVLLICILNSSNKFNHPVAC